VSPPLSAGAGISSFGGQADAAPPSRSTATSCFSHYVSYSDATPIVLLCEAFHRPHKESPSMAILLPADPVIVGGIAGMMSRLTEEAKSLRAAALSGPLR
jgi:hypothetical protein